MKNEAYTPGHSTHSRSFMAKRRADTHAALFLPWLKSGMHVLDCGCGPGTISKGLARRVSAGKVVGIDQNEEQIAEARELHHDVENLSFECASVYNLPFDANTFDAVFSHALFEHLGQPLDALREINRVLNPGGLVGLCSPDFDAFVIAPESPGLRQAFAFYRSKQESNGGDTRAGRKLVDWLRRAGFSPLASTGRCENYPEPSLIGEYLARQLDHDAPRHAAAFREWMRQPAALFAQMWIGIIARSPSASTLSPLNS